MAWNEVIKLPPALLYILEAVKKYKSKRMAATIFEMEYAKQVYACSTMK